jgi:hypothetical protein
MLKSIARVGACVCVAVMLVAACGGGSDKKTGGTPGNTVIGDPATFTATTIKLKSVSLSPCTVVGLSLASATLGGPAEQQTDASPSAVEPACLWATKLDGVNYLLQVRIGQGEQFYTGNIPGNVKLDGIGDKAAIREAGNGSEETLSFVKDHNSYTLALSAHAIGKTGLAKAKRDKLIELAKTVAGKQ